MRCGAFREAHERGGSIRGVRPYCTFCREVALFFVFAVLQSHIACRGYCILFLFFVGSFEVTAILCVIYHMRSDGLENMCSCQVCCVAVACFLAVHRF